MTRVVHFEISANNPEKVIPFYQKVFQWEIEKVPDHDYWNIKTGDDDKPGINGGFFKPNEWFSGSVNTIEVPNLDQYLDRVRANGGEAVTERIAIPKVGYLVYCRDVEHTLFGLLLPDPTAGGWNHP